MQPIEHTLADGTRIQVRDIRPDDSDELAAAFARLSPQSRHRRFLGSINLTPALLHYLTDVDGVDHVAIVATRADADGNEVGIGVARFIRLRDQPAIAEAAITVADEMQGKGVGRALAGCLAELAIARGIEHFRGEILVDNAPIRELLREVGAVTTPIEAGRLAFDISLTGRERPFGDIARRLMRAAAAGDVGSRLP
jgi:GNAT superfamily N-acetyltransferase